MSMFNQLLSSHMFVILVLMTLSIVWCASSSSSPPWSFHSFQPSAKPVLPSEVNVYSDGSPSYATFAAVSQPTDFASPTEVFLCGGLLPGGGIGSLCWSFDAELQRWRLFFSAYRDLETLSIAGMVPSVLDPITNGNYTFEGYTYPGQSSSASIALLRFPPSAPTVTSFLLIGGGYLTHGGHRIWEFSLEHQMWRLLRGKTSGAVDFSAPLDEFNFTITPVYTLGGRPFWDLLDVTGSIIFASSKEYSNIYEWQLSTNSWRYRLPNIGENDEPVYGPRGEFGSGRPAPVRLAAVWRVIDASNNIDLWEFGGYEETTYFRELWKYRYGLNQWMFVSGLNSSYSTLSSSLPISKVPNQFHPDNVPTGSSFGVFLYSDPTHGLPLSVILFGGDQPRPLTGSSGYSDTIWILDLSTSMWKHWAGSLYVGVMSEYDEVNPKLGGRVGPAAFQTTSPSTGNTRFWLMAGEGGLPANPDGEEASDMWFMDAVVCGGHSMLDSDVCGGHGRCIASEVCECAVDYQGLLCQSEKIDCFGFYYDDKERACSGNGNCVAQDSCACSQDRYGPECAERILSIVSSANIDDDEASFLLSWEIDTFYLTIDVMIDGTTTLLFDCSLITEGLSSGTASCIWEIMQTKQSMTQGVRFFFDSSSAMSSHSSVRVIPLTGIEEDAVTVSIKSGTGDMSTLVTSLSATFGTLFLLLAVLVVVIIVVTLCVVAKYRKNTNQLAEYDDVVGQQELQILRAEKLSQRGETTGDMARLSISTKRFQIEYDELEIERKIGQGGSNSTVFLCVWQERQVAFKCFRTSDICSEEDDFIEFEREVSILASISHPNILHFYGATLKPPRVGIIMEYCSNGDLSNYLKLNIAKSEDVTLATRIRFLKEIASAMRYLHTQFIIHRDLKLENVLLTEHEECRVMDFGLSKAVERSQATKTRRVGTSLYMAPEVVHTGTYNEKCDVYSYSILMWQILSLDFEPYSNDAAGLELRVANDPTCRPSLDTRKFRECPWALTLMDRCWAASPDHRPSFERISKMLSTQEIDQGDGTVEVDGVGGRNRQSSGGGSGARRGERTETEEELWEMIELLKREVEGLKRRVGGGD